MTLISEGAEARIYREDGIIRKVRIAKAYRHPRLDERLRISRTRAEARILERLSSLPSIPRLLTSEADTLCIEAINAPPIGIMHPDTIRQHAAQLANMLRLIVAETESRFLPPERKEADGHADSDGHGHGHHHH